METVEDFDKWLAEYQPPIYNYVAVFDPTTGKVTSVGPEFAFADIPDKIVIDNDLANSIISAEIQIHNCMVDIASGKLEIAEIKTLNKLDDVLHRIIRIEYSDTKNPDVYITHNKLDNSLSIQLSSELGGTKKYHAQGIPRKIVWDGSTVMNFLITNFNDPNSILQVFSIKVEDLVGKTVTIKDINYKNFSVYTKRLFKKYAIEHL